jgi:hypothetical protein
MCETDPGIVPADKWTHVAVVSDQKEFRIYADGKLVQKSDFQETDGGNENHYLGDTPFVANQSYSGILDEFAIFPGPLKETDIRQIIELGVEQFAAVEPKDKLATQWAILKDSR